MEKRNIIEDGRTPDLVKQAVADDFDKQASGLFKAMPTPVRPVPSLSVPWVAAAPQPLEETPHGQQ